MKKIVASQTYPPNVLLSEVRLSSRLNLCFPLGHITLISASETWRSWPVGVSDWDCFFALDRPHQLCEEETCQAWPCPTSRIPGKEIWMVCGAGMLQCITPQREMAFWHGSVQSLGRGDSTAQGMERQCLEVLSSLVPLPPWGGIGWAVIKKFGGVPPTQHASHRQDDCISSTEIAINVHLICHCYRLRGRPKLCIVLKEALNDGFSSRYVFCDVEGLIVEGRLIYWPQKSLQNNSAVNTFTLRDNTSHLQKVCGGLL